MDQYDLRNLPKLFQSNELVEVKIGTGNKKRIYFIHKEVLEREASFFGLQYDFYSKASAIGGTGDSKAAVKAVELTDTEDRADAFELFIQYAYAKDYQVEDKEDVRPHAYVYILADKFNSLELKYLALSKATEILVKLSGELKNGINRLGEERQKIVRKQVHHFFEVVGAVYGSTEVAVAGKEGIEGEDTAAKKTDEGDAEGQTNTVADVTADYEQRGSDAALEPFQVLLARFSGSCIKTLKSYPLFIKCVAEFKKFGVDLLMAVNASSPLEVDEFGMLKVT